MKKLILLILLLFMTGCTSNEYKNGEVNVLNWSSYIPNEVIKDFEKEYDIKVNYGTYSSNEELLAKISNSSTGTYDVVFPSDYMVSLMKERNMLSLIDKSKLSNYSNIDSIFLNQEYDLGNNYSLPFLMTHVVIAVDTSDFKEHISSYKHLINDRYDNSMVVIDDQRIIIGSALQALSYGVNDLNEKNYKEVKVFMDRLYKNIKAFDSDSPKTFLITDEVDIGIMWSAEAIMAKEYNKNIEIIIPRDGYALSMDNYTILKGSKNEDNAYKFINYLLRKDVNKRIIEAYPYISTLYNNNEYSSEEIEEIIKNGSYIENIGYNIKYYDNMWAEIK